MKRMAPLQSPLLVMATPKWRRCWTWNLWKKGGRQRKTVAANPCQSKWFWLSHFRGTLPLWINTSFLKNEGEHWSNNSCGKKQGPASWVTGQEISEGRHIINICKPLVMILVDSMSCGQSEALELLLAVVGRYLLLHDPDVRWWWSKLSNVNHFLVDYGSAVVCYFGFVESF